MVGMGTLGLGPDIATQSTATVKPTVWDSINKVLTNVVQPAANIYTQIKTNQVPGAVQQPGYPQPYQPQIMQPQPVVTQPYNTKKYLLIGGAVVVIGGVVYFLTKKKK